MIGIVDYGLGNIKAYANIYKRLNVPCKTISKSSDFNGVTKLILPGVGSFDYAIERLQKSELKKELEDLVLNKQIPILGVCVGMQLFAQSSEEGHLPGLGWVDGVVKKFNGTCFNKDRPLPHMGWNSVQVTKSNRLFNNMLRDLKFYFLHSYYFDCNHKEDIVAMTEYGNSFACVINHNNIYGIQCHPEKSHHDGITLLKNFGEL